MKTIVPTSARSGLSTGPLFALIVAGLAVAGCNAQGERISTDLPTDGYRTRYPITVQEGPETLDIPVGRGSSGLGPDLVGAVRSFGADAARNGTSGIAIMVPRGSANEATASYLARDIARVLKASGLAASLVEEHRYAVADATASAPIRLTFNRIKAVSPPCGRWSGNIMAGDKNEDGDEFGCTTQANLAAMVENPNDLIIPRAQTPIPAWKRWKIMQQYEAGSSNSSSTSSTASSSASGG
jgi:pilus assembly protein CpaD